MSGYYGIPEDPTLSHDGWIATGDLGRIEEGYLYLAGRLKDVIIRGGENVTAAHVENTIGQHPSVQEIAVVGLPDPDLGEVVGAAVHLSIGSNTSAAELIDVARRELAYFEVPSRWWIHAKDLPTNQTGKVDKRKLRALFPDGSCTDERDTEVRPVEP
jgi:long-chain acyl-CoA synthetase